MNPAFIGVTNGVGDARVRNARDIVHLGQEAPLTLIPGHYRTVAVAHKLYVDPLVVGVGVAVVAPEEGADFHLFPGGGEDLTALGGETDNLAGA